MRILSISIQKGGTGKSSTAQNLAAELAARGVRVLLVDMDPQASLTRSCGLAETSGRSVAEVLGGAHPGKTPLSEIVVKLDDNLSLAPSDIALAQSELGLTQRLGRESVLKKALNAASFDLAIIDTPPSLGLLAVNCLAAAHGVIVPAQPQAADLRSVKLFLQTLADIRAELNPSLELLGVLLTFYNPRLNLHAEALETLKASGLPLFDVQVGRSVKIAEAAGAGLPLRQYDAKNPQNENYLKISVKVQSWLKNLT